MKTLRFGLLLLCASVISMTTVRAQDLDLVGETGWDQFRSAIHIYAERVENNRDAGSSGFLRLQIWATDEPYDGVSDITGYVLGTFNIGSMFAGDAYLYLSRLVRYNRPPPGLYFTTITLEENTTEGFVIADSENFLDLVNLGGFGEGSAYLDSGNGDVGFAGEVSWLAGNGRVNFFAEQILNERASGRTGALRIRLWATSTPYEGEDFLQGYPMATRSIGRLAAGGVIPNFSRSTFFYPPPPDEYYVTMTLEEYFHGWNIVDYVTFDGTSIF